MQEKVGPPSSTQSQVGTPGGPWAQAHVECVRLGVLLRAHGAALAHPKVGLHLELLSLSMALLLDGSALSSSGQSSAAFSLAADLRPSLSPSLFVPMTFSHRHHPVQPEPRPSSSHRVLLQPRFPSCLLSTNPPSATTILHRCSKLSKPSIAMLGLPSFGSRPRAAACTNLHAWPPFLRPLRGSRVLVLPYTTRRVSASPDFFLGHAGTPATLATFLLRRFCSHIALYAAGNGTSVKYAFGRRQSKNGGAETPMSRASEST